MEYESYDRALADSDSYEAEEIVEVVSRKTQAYKNLLSANTSRVINNRQTQQNMFVISYAEPNRPLNVLELGGACGASFFELAHLLPGRIKSWRIVETPQMAAAGRKLFQDNTLRFFDELDAAISEFDSFDLVVAQGVLQYMRDPLQTLDDLLRMEFKHIYVSRTIVSEDIGMQTPIVIKQISDLSTHGRGALPSGIADRKMSTPLTITPASALAARIPAGYRHFWFDESEPQRMTSNSKIINSRMIGFLLTQASG